MNTQTPVAPVQNEEGTMAQDSTTDFSERTTEQESQANPEVNAERSWSEEIELAGHQLVGKATELLAEGNVRRLILRTPDDQVIVEIPLVAGAVVGGVITIFAPILAILGTVASVLAHVKVEIIRINEPPSEESPKE